MPYIAENTINRIKEHLNITAVVKDYVKLKKAGRNWSGLCPFHVEKTPSFSVSEEKGIYHCFGCNAGGNMFNFVMEIEKVTFPESIEILAKKAGINVEYAQGFSEEINKDKEKIYKVNEKASFIYNFYLKDKPEGALARQYLKERGIKPEMIDLFTLGYAPDDFDKLYKELLNEHFTDATILKAGLRAKSPKTNNYYDIFRNRLMFPIIDSRDNIIGFGGRAMSADVKAKYLNSPDTELFSKRNNLYGLNASRNFIREKKQAIVVEGYFDLITLFQSGIKNVVAPLGTALTNEHVLLLKRFAEEIVLLFDSDTAGNSATIRSISLLLNTNLKIKIAELPSNTDPDEFVMKHGPEKLLNIIDSAPGFLKFIIKDAFSKYNSAQVDGKNKILQFIFPIIKQVNNEILKSEVFRFLANKLGLDVQLLLNEFSKFISKGEIPVLKNKKEEGKLTNALVQAQRFVVMTLIEKPEYMSLVLKNIDLDAFSDALSQTILKAIKKHHPRGQITPDMLINEIQDEKIKEYITREIMSEKHSANVKKQLNDCLYKIKSYKIEQLIKTARAKIKQSDIFSEIKILEQEMQELMAKKHELLKNRKNIIE